MTEPSMTGCFKLIVCSIKIQAVFILLLLTGCGHDPSTVAVRELRTPPKVTRGEHVVSEGESLYSIAWLYNRDFRELASSNGIPEPFIIYPNQTINLDGKSQSKKRSVSATRKSSSSSVPRQKTTIKKQSIVKKTNSEPRYKSSGWFWPASGKIIRRYSLSVPVNKGIDIRGDLGEPVRAAGNGEVVYAGSDLTGYGRLIILKHNSSYLSAYAHNKELHVSEGDSVKAGQKIAEIGSTGTTEPKLHFEIRRNGKPVDPMGYLPRR